MPSTLWIAIAIIAVIIIRRFSRLVGSSLGLLTSFMLAGWGYWVYHHAPNVGISFAGFHLAEGMFYGFVALWAALEVFEISRAIAKRRHPPHPVGIDTDDSESPPADDDPK